MSKRLLIVGLLAAGAVGLSGCVVVPTEPAYGAYGYGGPPVVRAAPPAVVVATPPVVRYGHYPRPYYYRGW